MAAPTRIKDFTLPIAGESTSASDVTVTLSGFVPTGHIAKVDLRLSALENTQNYNSGGEAMAHESVWSLGRNDTGTTTADQHAMGSPGDEQIDTDGSPMDVAVTVGGDTGDLTITISVSQTDTLAVFGTARIQLFTYANSITNTAA